MDYNDNNNGLSEEEIQKLHDDYNDSQMSSGNPFDPIITKEDNISPLLNSIYKGTGINSQSYPYEHSNVPPLDINDNGNNKQKSTIMPEDDSSDEISSRPEAKSFTGSLLKNKLVKIIIYCYL